MMLSMLRPARRKDYMIPAWLKPVQISDTNMHALLRRLLAENEPQAMRWLRSLWRDQGRFITNDAMAQALLTGQVPAAVTEGMALTVQKFVTDQLLPLVTDQAQSLGAGWASGAGFSWEASPGLLDTLAMRADRLAVNLADEQLRAIDLLVKYHSTADAIPAGELAGRIRGFIGLTDREAQAVLNARSAWEGAGSTPSQVEELAARYESQLRQARALRIARTELSFASNEAQRDALDDARAKGLLSDNLVKEWSVADDEGSCPVCAGLGDGGPIPLSANFADGYDAPPAHPQCRCIIVYYELTPKD
jgi:hypothetical protein